MQYQQRERCQGDILVHSFNHPFCHPIRNLSATADIVLGVTLIYSTHISRGGEFSFDSSSILRSEGKKLQKYRAGYELNGLAFAPLVADAYGVIGPWALNFFHRVATVCGQSSDSRHDCFVRSPQSIYHSLRLRFLMLALEATAMRALSGWTSARSVVPRLPPLQHAPPHGLALSSFVFVDASVPL